MDKQEIYTQLVSILTPLCQAQGLELWGIELRFGAGGKHKLVRIYLDSPLALMTAQQFLVIMHTNKPKLFSAK